MIKVEYISENTPADLLVVNSARVSMAKERAEFLFRGDLRIPPGESGDDSLIAYLAREDHFTPFTHYRMSILMRRDEVCDMLIDAHPADLSGAVWSRIVDSSSIMMVRNSLYGWSKWVRGGLLTDEKSESVSRMLINSAPVSSAALGMRDKGGPADQCLYSPIGIVPKCKEAHFIDITVRETVPIFVARQRFKHTVGLTYNEVSRRYVDDSPELYEPHVWRKRADSVKQGSSDEPFTDGKALRMVGASSALAHAAYSEAVASGMSPEQARMVLPQSMMTSYYVTGSLAAFARSYVLRTHPTAQREIQDLARQWDKIIRPMFPEIWESLTGGNGH